MANPFGPVSYLTSQLYPIVVLETGFTFSMDAIISTSYWYFDDLTNPDQVTWGSSVVSGSLTNVVVSYVNWPVLVADEQVAFTGAHVVSGALSLGLIQYLNWPVLVADEQVAFSNPTVVSGALTFGLIQYLNWPVLVADEQITLSTSVVSGSLI